MTDGFDIPVGKGLLITLQGHGKLVLTVVDDKNFPDIHPNCYAPADCTNLEKLRGGGSGTAVFAADHPKLGSIVMKHAGYKDSKEVFALAHISSELHRRSQGDAAAAAADMKRRIPVFVMAYLSCYHLRDRAKELWSQLACVSYSPLGERFVSRTESLTDDMSPVKENGWKIPKIPVRSSFADPRVARRIRVRKSNDDEESIRWSVGLTYVDIFIPYETIDGQMIVTDHTFLQRFAEEIGQQLVDNKWKLTLAQQRIGGSSARNGADILAACQLKGSLLETLVKEFSLIVHHLCALTEESERLDGLAVAKEHFQTINGSTDVTLVSQELDGFVGGAIIKNFHPEHGRYRTLRAIGAELRQDSLFLTPGETVPAMLLGKILERKCCLGEIFMGCPVKFQSAMDHVEERGWRMVLQDATQFSSRDPASRTTWTSGLTDAGLHNTFLSLNRGLEIFDLGEPGLQSQPAFFTKFLMSFFHTLGMESNTKGTWYQRFDVVKKGKRVHLKVTATTRTKMACAEQSFVHTLDQVVSKVFDGDRRVRQLLIQYVVLQLLSDSAFCLQRWEAKGGGVLRYGERLKDPLEKWLWRCIWDQYVASVVIASYVTPVKPANAVLAA